nr:LysM peptidoglycan-binding domain-containing protein [Streptomyces venezuelae]
MSTPVRLLRVLLGLAVLAALIAGIPLVLLAVGYQPTDFTGGWDLLTQQDDGRLFFTVLTTIGWIGWALFTLSALVEIVALFRNRKAKRIKGLGGMQSFAGFLIGGLVLLAPTAASAAPPGPAAAATAVQTAGTSSAATTEAAAAAEQNAWPTHTVTGDSELPWDLAEQYLGSGPRWKDIAALNPSIPELAAGDQFLPKGAVIRLPADANIAKPATPAPAPTQAAPETATPTQQPAQAAPKDAQPAAAEAKHVVKPDETLWGIADQHGNPEDWPKIFEANKGKPLPGGGTFDNPDLIVPGQELTLPTATDPAPAPDSRPAQDTKTPPKPDTAKDTPTPAAPAPEMPANPAPAPQRPAPHPPLPPRPRRTLRRRTPPSRPRKLTRPWRPLPSGWEPAPWPPPSSARSPPAASSSSAADDPAAASPCPPAAPPPPSRACAPPSTPPASTSSTPPCARWPSTSPRLTATCPWSPPSSCTNRGSSSTSTATSPR